MKHTMEKRQFSLTEEIFREINSLLTYLVNSLLSRNFCQKSVRENFRNFHTVLWECQDFSATQILREINFTDKRERERQCGNYGILVSHFFGKNFVKATVLLNKLLNS